MTAELTQNTESHLTLSERLRVRRNTTTLLVDTSGSMASDCEPGLSKIQALRNVVAGISGSPIVFWFADAFGQCDKDSIPDPTGCTYAAPALQHLRDLGYCRLVLITDGDISDKERTLEAAKGMNIKCMYIGAGARPEFLDKLANMCGGYATTNDLTQQKLLTEKIQLLLNAGEPARGAFEL
jgi:hypothetical protein